jgi:tetratricopeptide (TPR) repeat protein
MEQNPSQKASLFPHFFRNITALFSSVWKYFFIALLLSLIVINLLHSRIFGFTKENELKIQIMAFPSESIYHERLAHYYLSVNHQASEREFALAEELLPESTYLSENILGLQSSPWQYWLKLQKEKERLRQETTYWQNIASKFPDYRYALVKLAVLHHSLGEKEESDKYLQMLLKNDPANELVLSLKDKLR